MSEVPLYGGGAATAWGAAKGGSHMQALIIYKLGFNKNNQSFTLILPIEIVL
jgi:hypothetical protein